jgi:hypothetical protein
LKVIPQCALPPGIQLYGAEVAAIIKNVSVEVMRSFAFLEYQSIKVTNL